MFEDSIIIIYFVTTGVDNRNFEYFILWYEKNKFCCLLYTESIQSQGSFGIQVELKYWSDIPISACAVSVKTCVNTLSGSVSLSRNLEVCHGGVSLC